MIRQRNNQSTRRNAQQLLNTFATRALEEITNYLMNMNLLQAHYEHFAISLKVQLLTVAWSFLTNEPNLFSIHYATDWSSIQTWADKLRSVDNSSAIYDTTDSKHQSIIQLFVERIRVEFFFFR